MSFLKLLRPRKAATSSDEPSSSSEQSADSDSDESSTMSGDRSRSRISRSMSGDAEELRYLRNKQRTEKARAAVQFNRLKRKQEASSELPQHPAEEYRRYLTSNDLTSPAVSFREKKSRLRLLYSWLLAFVGGIGHFFTKEKKIEHTISVVITDDTNMRLAMPYAASGKHRTSRVVSVMSLLQTLVCSFTNDSGERRWRSFHFHTPLVPLERADTKGLACELLSWLFVYLGRVGERFARLGVKQDVVDAVPLQACVICWDSLKTNMSILKGLRIAVHSKHTTSDSGDLGAPLCPLFSCRCCIHQIALCRKMMLFFFAGHWSSIVRLAHLFESHRFISQFRSSMLQIVYNSFEFISVSELPREHVLWERARSACMLTEDRHYPVARLRLHRQLMGFDNGDPSSNRIVHWCTGVQCPCGGSKKKALLQTCRLYSELFSRGFAVPLTYRWLKAHPALQYCKVSWHSAEAFLFPFVGSLLFGSVWTSVKVRKGVVECQGVRSRDENQRNNQSVATLAGIFGQVAMCKSLFNIFGTLSKS